MSNVYFTWEKHEDLDMTKKAALAAAVSDAFDAVGLNNAEVHLTVS